MNICVIHPNPGPACETFIRAHIEGLPGVAEVLHGGHMPYWDDRGRPLLARAGMDDVAPGGDAQGFPPSGDLEHPAHQARAQALGRVLVEAGVDVVLAEYGPTGVAAMHACRARGIPLVVHFHGCDASMRPVLEKYGRGYGRLWETASAVVAVSEEMAGDLTALGVPPDILHRNPYGVDTRRFVPTDPAANPPLFVAVGRFVEKKAPDVTLRAFAEVARAVPEARLVMAGDGALRPACMDLAGELGLGGAVEFPGNVDHARVAELMRSARCFVQHSATAPNGDKEGMPNSVLEACASGLPVVSTLHAGIPEAVPHGRAGLLCAQGDEAAFAANMLRLAREPDTAGRMGRAARDHVEAGYDMIDRLAALADILRNAARRTP